VRLEDRRAAFLDALLLRDSGRARLIVEGAVEDGVPVPDVYLGVIEHALREVGDRWARGELNVASEHYATSVAQSILDGLVQRMPRPPKDGRLAVVTGTPRELNVFGARVIGDFLAADGWEVIRLGAGVPESEIIALAESEQPELVAVSTTTAGVLDGVADVLGGLRALSPRPLVIAGGQFWTPETTPTALGLGADLVIDDPRELVATVAERIPRLEG
jgi:MerR family transcriptional regulator, light-induced transcriptional regulator